MKKKMTRKQAKRYARIFAKHLTVSELKMLILSLVDEYSFNVNIPSEEAEDEQPAYYVV